MIGITSLRRTIDGDHVRLRQRQPIQGTRLGFRFDGRLGGGTMEGEVGLGEYGQARWTARRAQSRRS